MKKWAMHKDAGKLHRKMLGMIQGNDRMWGSATMLYVNMLMFCKKLHEDVRHDPLDIKVFVNEMMVAVEVAKQVGVKVRGAISFCRVTNMCVSILRFPSHHLHNNSRRI